MPGFSLSEFLQINKKRNTTYILPFAFRGCFQRINRFPRSTKDTQHFKPEQKLGLQELVLDRCIVSRYRSDEVLVPRPASVFQRLANVFFDPFLQVNNL